MQDPASLAAFKASPAGFVERFIKEYVWTSPANALPAFGNKPVFREPLVGFADGDDPIFQEYKAVVGDFHMTPREALERCCSVKPPRITVVSFIMPFAGHILESLRRESQMPSLQWNHARWKGQEIIDALSRELVSMFQKLGQVAAVPDLNPCFETRSLPNGRASNWSHRHMAFAAGLGTFGLSDGFISAGGIAMRCGSVVTDAVIPPTPRLHRSHMGNCLQHRDGSCGKCIQRCPAGAISEKGHDKVRCRDYVVEEQPVLIKKAGREGFMGRYAGCGLCQAGVPCESGIPAGTS